MSRKWVVPWYFFVILCANPYIWTLRWSFILVQIREHQSCWWFSENSERLIITQSHVRWIKSVCRKLNIAFQIVFGWWHSHETTILTFDTTDTLYIISESQSMKCYYIEFLLYLTCLICNLKENEHLQAINTLEFLIALFD